MRTWIIVGFVSVMMLALPGLTLAEDFFSQTELQIHADLDRQPVDSAIWTATLEHFSEWSYGDNFFFLDIEGKEDLETEAETLYFEYAPRVSLDRVFKKEIIPCSFLGVHSMFSVTLESWNSKPTKVSPSAYSRSISCFF